MGETATPSAPRGEGNANPTHVTRAGFAEFAD